MRQLFMILFFCDDDVTYLPTLNTEIFWCCQKIKCVYDSV